MRLVTTILLLLFLSCASCVDPAERARLMLQKMTLEEKITMCHGGLTKYTGEIAGNDRLGIPPLRMNDGPQGFRTSDDSKGTTTGWPSALTLAATFDTQLASEWGHAMGQEFRDKGAGMQLGPGVNVARLPECGRNFEYLSGEDPFLGRLMVAPVVQGIQAEGVIANVKHFVNNNQEHNRGLVSAVVDERTEWEIYFHPFHAAVEAGALSVMCSYNKINGTYSCENAITLSLSLKQRMNFSGFVVSDWGGTHSTVAAANAGLDVEMPVGVHFSDVLLKEAVDNGSVSIGVIDDKVTRILTAMYSVGLFDHPCNGSLTNNVTSDKNNNLARRIAAAAAVLLKNDNGSDGQPLLPITPTNSTRIAVIGSCASTNPLVHGQGSGEVLPPYIITLLQGVSAAAPSASVSYHETHDVVRALEAAREATHVIIAACTVSGEGHDRTFPSKDHTRTDSVGLALPAEEDALIDAVSEVSRNVVVVVTHPGAILLPWAQRVAAVVCMTVPGQEAGNAAADVLFGRVNPSGRLPVTMPFGNNDMNMTHEQYPFPFGLVSTYTEKLNVGYRWYHAHKVQPRFPFGHGLSYTSFVYGSMVLMQPPPPLCGGVEVFDVCVAFNVSNAGAHDGADVPQLYITYPAAAEEPPRQLRFFTKVMLRVGETSEVTMPLRLLPDLAIWSVETHAFVQVPGAFTLEACSSSAVCTQSIELKL